MIYMRHDVYIKKINYFRVLGTISLVRKLFVLLMVLLICFFLHKSFGIFSFFVLFSIINTPLIHLLLNREAFLINFYGICRVFFKSLPITDMKFELYFQFLIIESITTNIIVWIRVIFFNWWCTTWNICLLVFSTWRIGKGN